MRKFKYAETGVVTRISFRIPLESERDPMCLPLWALINGVEDTGFLFPGMYSIQNPISAAAVEQTVQLLLEETGARALLGMKFTKKSLRSGEISATHKQVYHREVFQPP